MPVHGPIVELIRPRMESGFAAAARSDEKVESETVESKASWLRSRSGMGATAEAASVLVSSFFDPAVWRAAFVEFVTTVAMDFMSYTAVTAILNSGFHNPALMCGLIHIPIHSLAVLAAFPASGGHLNPTITLTTFLTGHTSLGRSLLYIAAHCAAGITAALCSRVVVSKELAEKFFLGGCTLEMPGPPGPDGGSTITGLSSDAGFVSEFMFSFIFLYLSYFIALDPAQLQAAGPMLAALLLGAILAMVLFVSGSVSEAYSGAGLNPARCLGPAIALDLPELWDNHWRVWWAAPALASIVVAAIYHSVPPHHLEAYSKRHHLLHRIKSRLRSGSSHHPDSAAILPLSV